METWVGLGGIFSAPLPPGGNLPPSSMIHHSHHRHRHDHDHDHRRHHHCFSSTRQPRPITPRSREPGSDDMNLMIMMIILEVKHGVGDDGDEDVNGECAQQAQDQHTRERPFAQDQSSDIF